MLVHIYTFGCVTTMITLIEKIVVIHVGIQVENRKLFFFYLLKKFAIWSHKTAKLLELFCEK